MTFHELQQLLKYPVRVEMDGMDYYGRVRDLHGVFWEIVAVNGAGKVRVFELVPSVDRLQPESYQGGLSVYDRDDERLNLFFYVPRYDVF